MVVVVYLAFGLVGLVVTEALSKVIKHASGSIPEIVSWTKKKDISPKKLLFISPFNLLRSLTKEKRETQLSPSLTN